MTTLRTVREITTSDLTAGVNVIRAGRPVQVVEVTDTGRPAVFGTGTEWNVTLQDETGRRTEMAAATSQRWKRA